MPPRSRRDSSSRCAPTRGRAAILLDVDGTLAPIVDDPEQARGPGADPGRPSQLASRYGLVGCLTGRRASAARRIVGVDEHHLRRKPRLRAARSRRGGADARPGARRPRGGGGRSSSRGSTAASSTAAACGSRTRARSRRSTGAARPTSSRGERRAQEVAELAAEQGLLPRWGRKVLELRPVTGIHKGSAARAVIAESRDQRRVLRRRRHVPTSTRSPRCAAGGRGRARARGLRRRSARRSSRRELHAASGPWSSTGRRASSRPVAGPLMLFCDLLRVTVLLVAGVATALGAVTVVVANRDSTTRP